MATGVLSLIKKQGVITTKTVVIIIDDDDDKAQRILDIILEHEPPKRPKILPQ